MTLKDTSMPAAQPADAPAGAGRPGASSARSGYRSFWRKLEATLGAFRAKADVAATLDQIILICCATTARTCHLVAGRLYEKVDADRYVLRRWHGDNTPAKIGYTVPITYPAVQILLDRGLLIMKETDPEFDPQIEDPLGVSAFAAMTLGDDNKWLLSFSIEGEYDRERMLYLLSAVQHVVTQKIQQARYYDALEEAAHPDVAVAERGRRRSTATSCGTIVQAETVGGDLFDFLPLSDRILASRWPTPPTRPPGGAAGARRDHRPAHGPVETSRSSAPWRS